MASSKTLGIVGYGDIGYQVAKKVKNAFGMKISAYVRNPASLSDDKKALLDEIYTADKLDSLFQTSDFVCACLPQTDHTIDFMDMAKFKKMKPSAIFMNIGRGKTIKEKEMI